MKRRYFLVESKEADELIKNMNEHNEDVRQKVIALREEVGASDIYTDQSYGNIVGVTFDERPDEERLYKRVQGERGLFYPRKNTKEGRELAKKFESIPELMTESTCGILELFDLKGSGMLSGMTLYMPNIHIIPNNAVYISIPSHDIPLEELERRKASGQTDTNLNSMISSAKWIPPECFTELKEWEVQKAYDEYNESLK
jgi:hypothetical protein